jgi:predicted DNA binding CopG/RHH family protein
MSPVIQVRVPPKLAEWVKVEASKEGLTSSAWVRRLLLQENDRKTRKVRR